MMRKVFNCFAVGWFLFGISYFISTFVYGMFFTDKIQARADTLEKVYQQELGILYLHTKSEHSEIARGGYRLSLEKQIIVDLSPEKVVHLLEEKEKDRWNVDECIDRENYYYRSYAVMDNQYGISMMVMKDTIGSDAEISLDIYFNDFYTRYGL